MSAYDELLRLCAEMHAAGERLSYDALRRRRGYGSRRDIARALRAWRQQTPDAPSAVSGRPSQTEMRLRAIIQSQRATINDLNDNIRILKGEVASLARMVQNYSGCPEDEIVFEVVLDEMFRASPPT